MAERARARAVGASSSESLLTRPLTVYDTGSVKYESVDMKVLWEEGWGGCRGGRGASEEDRGPVSLDIEAVTIYVSAEWVVAACMVC